MKIAVYDEWWTTAGGGEKFAAGIASVLAGSGAAGRSGDSVELLAHDPVDLGCLSERLQLDLANVGVRVIDRGQVSVEEASEDYDLFVNASYFSQAVNRARHGLYVVHFPNPPAADGSGWKRPVKQVLRPLVAMPGVSVSMARGFHPEEMIGRHRVQWTTGDATVDVRLPEGQCCDVTVLVGRFVGAAIESVPVDIEVDGKPVLSLAVRPPNSRLGSSVLPVEVPVQGRPDGEPVRIRITSGTRVPAEVFGTDDLRTLGVPVCGVQVGPSMKARLRSRYPSLAGGPAGFGWIESYDRIVSNSQYTRSWVNKWWEIDTPVLNPPVTMQSRMPKDNIILNVGRFFSPEHGHCKKQLDMVRAMRALQWRGKSAGWTLHLVGGCSPDDRPYLEKVEREAAGLPVEIHVDASGSALRDLYGRASIYWHATGLGEDPESQPDRFEHFGITTAEAMSAGAVPVVIMAAGQEEIVEHGVSGLLWESLVQLVCFTEDLILDPERLRDLSAGAEERAKRYGIDEFGARLRGFVQTVVES